MDRVWLPVSNEIQIWAGIEGRPSASSTLLLSCSAVAPSLRRCSVLLCAAAAACCVLRRRQRTATEQSAAGQPPLPPPRRPLSCFALHCRRRRRRRRCAPALYCSAPPPPPPPRHLKCVSIGSHRFGLLTVIVLTAFTHVSYLPSCIIIIRSPIGSHMSKRKSSAMSPLSAFYGKKARKGMHIADLTADHSARMYVIDGLDEKHSGRRRRHPHRASPNRFVSLRQCRRPFGRSRFGSASG